jgi:hypothetical protein
VKWGGSGDDEGNKKFALHFNKKRNELAETCVIWKNISIENEKGDPEKQQSRTYRDTTVAVDQMHA